jgi:hypothetical protein
MPTAHAARAAEATRRLLPELGKLDRRAFSAKQNALRKLADVLKIAFPAVRSGDVE